MTRDSHEMKTQRITRGGSLFGADQQTQLKLTILNNDYPNFKKIVSTGSVELEHIYGYPDYKTCLEIAASEKNRHEFVKLLLQNGVQVNNINETYAAAPLHFAVENGNIEAVKALLEDDRIDVNIKSKGNTPLLLAIKKIQDIEDDDDAEDSEVYENIIKLLLEFGCDVNLSDLKGNTAVHLAAKEKFESVLNLLQEYSIDRFDLDSYKDRSGKTARQYLKDFFPQLLEQFDANQETNESIEKCIDKLFYYLSKQDEENFITTISKLKNRNEHRAAFAANNGSSTMLQMATEKGLHKVVRTLLNFGADPNYTCSSNLVRPIAIACQNGYCKILKMFVENESSLFDSNNGESLLHYTVKGIRSKNMDPKSDFKGCLEILLKNPNIDVNFPDVKDNTPLHYAARNGDNDTVIELLRNGACVGLRNKFNEPPLADINAKTLEKFLDECITPNHERPSDDNYEIYMTYRFLVHANNSLENKSLKNVGQETLINDSNNVTHDYDTILAPETDALLFMTRNEELKPLLKHPVITSFLYLKWQRISCLFYTNISFYSLLWLCLILYILLGYGVEKQKSKSIETLSVICHIGAIVGLILLIIREMFQLLVSPIQYIQSFVNWMEIALIFVTAIIVGYGSASEPTKQQLSAVAILLSSTELVLLIGQFPTLSTNIVMLRTVSWNFFKFLLWYCILIIAFALSFYTLFRKIETEDQTAPDPNKTSKDADDDEEDFFEDPARSLFKTIVMLTGEFDAGSIKFSTFPVTSHIIFTVFVFMIPIVLFNLLNGLAVSDTQEIRADAELVGIVSRVKLITYFESVLIGNNRAYAKPFKPFLCFPLGIQDFNVIRPNMFCIKPFAKRISLFPLLKPNYGIVIKPNKNNKIEISSTLKKNDDSYDNIEIGGCCVERFQSYRLDGKIVKTAKAIINKKNDASDKLNEYESKLDHLENTMKQATEILESVKYLESTFKTALHSLESIKRY